MLSNPDGDKHQAFHDELEGIVYSQMGRVQEAELSFKNALNKEPSRLSSRNYLAALDFQTHRLDDALRELDQSIKLDPTQPRAFYLRGVILENMGELTEAKESYTQALNLDPDLETAANNLAYILANEGRDLEVALNWARVARRRQPDNPSTADTLGWVYYKLGSYVLARNQLQLAVSKQPDNGVYQYHLGMAFRHTAQLREAEAALKKAVASPMDFKEKSLAQVALNELLIQRK